MTWGKLLASIWHERQDLLRALMLVLLFRPLAYLLPQRALHGLGLACAVPLTLGFWAGRQAVREYQSAFGVTRGRAFRMALGAQARRFTEFTLQQKILAGMHSPWGREIRIEAGDEARALMASQASLVVAQTHFVRDEAAGSLLAPEVFGRPVIGVALKIPGGLACLNPHVLRIRVQLGQLLRASRVAQPTLKLMYTGQVFSDLLDELAGGRFLVTINVDAHWRRGRASSLTRPFAGARERTFSTGGAKLARLAKVPLLLVLPVFAADGGIRMRILGPFRSTLADDLANDRDVTNQMLDVIEKEIGTRPLDYVLAIGGERGWDATAGSWREPAQTATMAKVPLGVTGN